jgi:cytochrome c oxidase subunit 1
VLSLGAVYSIIAGIYHWFIIVTGNILNELLGKLMFISFFTSSNLIFLPMQYTGLSAYPRRVSD